LAASAEELNRDTPGDSRVLSVVALIEEGCDRGVRGSITPTFRIVPGPPEGHSYAIDLAGRFGISKEQLIETLVQRGQVLASG
jgi:hypothetical protein